MGDLVIIVFAILAYLIGSLPTSVWLGEAYFGIDIRDYGSGNAGATNTFRVLGKRAGIIVMLVDIFKGWTATSLALLLNYMDLVSDERLIFFKLAFGVLAVIGHIFPVYENFKGGKGVATLLGMVLASHFQAAMLCVLVFLIVLLASKYVSLGSILAALAFPISMVLPIFGKEPPVLIIFGFAIFIIVVVTHQKNIIRLLNGQESRTFLIRRRR